MTNTSNTVGELAPESGLRAYAYSEEVVIESDEEVEKFLEISALEYLAELPSYTGERNTAVEIDSEQAPSKTPEDARRKKISKELGSKAATRGMLGWSKLIDRGARKSQKLQERLDKLATNEDDSRVIKTKKKLARAAALTIAATTTVAGLAAYLSTFRGVEMGAILGTTLASDNIDMMPVTSDFGTVIVAGGAGQGNGNIVIPEMDEKAYLQDGYNVETVQYPGEIGPVVGSHSMAESGAIGAADMYAKAIDDLHAGRPTQLIGYSEGSYVALETANRIIAENGGVKPDNLSITIIGSPYAQGGLLGSNSPFANAAGPVLDLMGIPKGEHVPAGTHIIYNDSDFWANSGNQVPTSMMRQLIELGFGGHAIPDPNNPSYTFTDSDGVIHTVYTPNDVILQTLQDQTGLYIADTETANKAINDLFPLDGGKPNVALFKEDLITTLENQGDPLSTFAAQFIKNLPPEYTKLGQQGMDGFNDFAEGAAKIASGDVLGGMQQIMSALGNFMSIMGEIAPQGSSQGAVNTQGQVQQLLSSNLTGFLQQTTGNNYSAAINGFMNVYQQTAETTTNAAAVTSSDAVNQFVGAVSNHLATVDNTVSQSVQESQQSITDIVKDSLNTNVSVNVDVAVTPRDVIPQAMTPESVPTTTPNPVSTPVETPVFAPTATPVHEAPEIIPPAASVNEVSAPPLAPAPAPTVAATPEYTPPAAPVYEAPVAPVHEAPEIIPPAPPVYEAPTPAPAPVVVDIPPAPAPVTLPMPEIVAPAPPPTPAPAPTFDFTPAAPAPTTAPSSSSSTPSFGDFLNAFKPAA